MTKWTKVWTSALGVGLLLGPPETSSSQSEDPFHEAHPSWSQPDLSLHSVSITPNPADPGSEVLLVGTVTNEGAGDAPPSELTVSLAGSRVTTARVGELRPREARRIRAVWRVSDPGVFPVKAELQSIVPAYERSVENNVAYVRVRVSGVRDAEPELEVTWEELSSVTLQANHRIVPRLTVRNVGLGVTPEVPLDLYQNGTRVSSQDLPRLEPGASHLVDMGALPLAEGGNLFTARTPWPEVDMVPSTQSWLLIASGSGDTLPGAGDWKSIGPSLIEPQNWAGRMTCFAFHPTNRNILYAGGEGHSDNGPGLWKSIDGGLSWHPLTDHLATMSVASVALDPQRPSHVYFGSGFLRPAGIWKSADGGTTWNQYVFPSGIGGATRVSRLLLVYPGWGTATVLYAATDVGLYRHVLSNPSAVSSISSQWTLIKSGSIMDLVANPTNPDLLYASVYGDGLYRTTFGSNAMGDGDWTPLRTGLPPAQPKQFIRLDVHREQTNLLYASVYLPTTNHLLGIYRSEDGGSSWSALQLWAKGDLPTHPYNPFLRISPTDPPYLYFGGVHLLRGSERPSGGVDVVRLDGAAHDLKALEFDPSDPTRYFSLGDQGVFEGRHAAAGDTITPRNNELRVAQFFDVDASEVTPGKLLGGTQDTGTLLVEPGLSPPKWKMVRGGDGNYSLILPPNASGVEVLFSEHQYFHEDGRGPVMWSNDDGAHWTAAWQGLPDDSYYLNWTRVSLAKHPTNPNRVFAQGETANALDGPSFQQWYGIGPQGPAVKGRVNRVSVQPGTNTIMAATTTGQVWYTTKGGGVGNWNLAFERSFDEADVRSMAFSKANPRVLYLLSNGGTRKDMRIIRLEQSPASDTWNATGYMGQDLPGNLGHFHAISGDGWNPDVAYVGTSAGVLRCDNTKPAGLGCEDYSQGLPRTAVYDLLVEPTTRMLVAATHARGAWSVVTQPRAATDLLPTKWDESLPDPNAYCNSSGDMLQVRIANAGTVAGDAHVLVTFDHGGSEYLNLGTIQAGQNATGSVRVSQPIPAGGFNFEIRVIPTQSETDLDNNIVRGHCLG